MMKIFLSGAKMILGKKLYNEIRAKILFQNLNSPFPMKVRKASFNIDWNRYSPTDDSTIVEDGVKAVYIVSPTQRSGTNFLSHMLSSHPDINFPSGPDLPSEHCLYIYSDYLKMYAYKTVNTWSKWIEGGDQVLEQHAKNLLSAMGGGILNYFSKYVRPGSTILFKTPDAGQLENFFHLFPQAKVVILLRDGRDTVESFSKSWGGRFTFKNICERWSKRVDSISDFINMANEAGLSDRHHVVRYDYLNDNPKEELSKILKFLKVDESKYPWEQVDQIPILGSSNHKGKNGVHWNPIKKDDKFNPNQKWLKWNSSKKETFKKAAGDNLIKLGFAENNQW